MDKQTLVIFGGAGLVGSRFIELYKDSFEIFSPTANELDFTDVEKTREFIKSKNPGAVINFAAITNVEASQSEKDNKEGPTFKINATAVKNLAQIAKEFKCHLIHTSTEYVFDGQKENLYTEEDGPNPINWYGATKYFAEIFLKEVGDEYTIMRIAMPFSAHYDLKKDIARTFLEKLQNGEEISAITDSDITPTFVDDIANALKVLVDKKPQGIYHIVSSSTTSPFQFAKKIAQLFNLNEKLVKKINFDEYNENKKAKLLKNSGLSNLKFIREFGAGILHTVEESLEEFKNQVLK